MNIVTEMLVNEIIIEMYNKMYSRNFFYLYSISFQETPGNNSMNSSFSTIYQ